VSWVYKLTERAVKDLRRLSETDRRRIFRYLDERIATEDDPRRFGKALRGDLAGLWRYRVGDCRIICEIRDGELLVLVVAVGNRRDIYG
jgi:mRNA interferase RelE/StbE